VVSEGKRAELISSKERKERIAIIVTEGKCGIC